MFPPRTHEETIPCKCCGQPALLYDLCDFSKNCEELRGKQLPLSGIAIYYYRCGYCGFIFTRDFDQASDAEFRQHIYNDGYIGIDPDYEIVRPEGNARLIGEIFGKQLDRLSVLDYGGGNGTLARLLKEAGVKQAVSYDPFHDPDRPRPQKKYKLVTAFEVIEHVPDPVATFREMAAFLAPENSAMLFSTLVQPAEIDALKCRWWYIAPRNGHISIHSSRSLALTRLGFTLTSFNANLHLAYRSVPDFAQHLFRR